MTIRNRSLSSVCFAAMLSAVGVSAQAPTAKAPVRQTAYIKASNPHMEDHFGDGGPLEGHGVALSGDGRTMAVAATSESSASKGINGYRLAVEIRLSSGVEWP